MIFSCCCFLGGGGFAFLSTVFSMVVGEGLRREGELLKVY